MPINSQANSQNTQHPAPILSTSSTAPPQAMAEESHSDENAISLFIAEKNENDILMLAAALQEGEITINLLGIAPDHTETLAFLRKEGQHDKAETPDLLLLDFNIGEEEGFDLLRKIKTNPLLLSLPILIFTESHEQRKAIKALGYEGCSFIAKPAGSGEFKQTARRIELYWMQNIVLPNLRKRNQKAAPAPQKSHIA